MSVLEAKHIHLTFPKQQKPVLQDINLTIEEGSLTVILGESGCGKTTLLNILAGFQKPSSGDVLVNHEVVTGPDVTRAVVFQDHALLPWLNVADNVGFALQLKGLKRAEIEKQVSAILKIVGLSHVEKANIWELSGGMKQRVGIARALISHAPFILLDEPFAALDAFTRENMQQLVLDLWIQQNKSFFLITHDIEEALLLSNQLVLMTAHPGKIVETLHLDFANRYRQGESIRSIKSDSQFIQLREQLFESLRAQKQSGKEALPT
ncbi:ATP-binding cassette domain-containing protein [Acinetobacter baumannii]|uniref:taurine ABC transporter ATP-binding protein n=1 Tax=Acinetobacter calcoaceticus/baumannii complex TaxID=909768 RepID=UPI000461A068|nr:MULTISPECIES: ATP-binding cassette domain-containing protein [Acinetobacter calcoaceticus/baumannii complex]KCY50177.1 ABC transporter family protein [Acinetobacter baumannii 1571545]EKX9888252.1 ATP-binding cassette domain-containing protein [Acinetobacter baumannii]ELA9135077.1 ATP-binding cassette domain-containing protein [Acinetobacter baumannii]ELW9268731.1 ATP-binding cassette domain-containing protein [Acinetobacter baumannii]MDC4140617.1 ATP-binding cassette domain-containing prote